MGQDLSSVELLQALVGFPTVSRDSNLELVAWVENYLSSHGVSSTRVYDETGQKAALYANVGPVVEGGVVLSGHTDVVPVDGQDWSTDPFKLTQKDGRLYGRGTCDMKGFDALALWAVPRALKGRAKLRWVDLTLLAASVPALEIPSEEDESMRSTIAEGLKKPLAGSEAGLPKRVASVHREQRVPVVPTWPSQAVYASERKDSDAEVQNAFD